MNKNEIFWNYVKDNLSAREYEELPELIGCAPKRLAWIKSGNTDFDLGEIRRIAKLLHRNPRDLIMEYGIGQSNITIKEMNQLAAMDGMEVGLIAHVA